MKLRRKKRHNKRDAIFGEMFQSDLQKENIQIEMKSDVVVDFKNIALYYTLQHHFPHKLTSHTAHG